MSTRLTTEEFITKARKVHGDRYDYSQVEYVSAKQNVTIVCPVHGPFEQTPSNHIFNKHRCSLCFGTRQLSTGEFIDRAQSIHGNKYEYALVEYTTIHQPVTIVCPLHGPFRQRSINHLLGMGCQRCSGRNQSTTEEFISKARKVHGEKYDYSQVEYSTVRTKITIACHEHGPFNQRPNDHLTGYACPGCGGRQQSNAEEFIVKAQKVHGEKYDYSQVDYTKSHQKVTIGCREHGPFNQRPNDHIQGNGCPACMSQGYSRKAIRWLDQISKEQNINIQHAENGGEFKIPGTRMKADGYCVETNTIYEFHGDTWHGNPLIYEDGDRCHPFNRRTTAGELYQKTLAREEKIRSIGYDLVVMWESEFDGDLDLLPS